MNDLILNFGDIGNILYQTKRITTTGAWVPATRLATLPTTISLVDTTSAKLANVVNVVYITSNSQLNYTTVNATTNVTISNPINIATQFSELANLSSTNLRMKRLSCAFVGVELNLVILMSDNTVKHYIKNSTNVWRRGAIPANALTFGASMFDNVTTNFIFSDIDCFTVNASLPNNLSQNNFNIAFSYSNQLIRMVSDVINGTVGASNSYHNLHYSQPIQLGEVKFVSGVSINDRIHYAISSNVVGFNTTRLLHIESPIVSGISSLNDLSSLYNSNLNYADVSCSFVNTDLHVTAITDEPITVRNVKHTVLNASGTWQSFLGNVNNTALNIGRCKHVSIC
jgi:hypothetical protein